MELTIITPLQKNLYTIAWIELNTEQGNFVIQLGHVPMIITLSPHEKVTFCLNNGKRESLMVRQGIAHITRTTTTLILNEQ
jgi:F0F1-type ATP synthase epsilon subunit